MADNRGGRPNDYEHKATPSNVEKKAGQQPRPNHVRPERPSSPPPPPPTSQGKTD